MAHDTAQATQRTERAHVRCTWTHNPQKQVASIMPQNIGRARVCVNDKARVKNLCVMWKYSFC